MEEVYAATTFNTRQLFKYFSAFVVIPKHSEKICQPSDTSAKETCSGRVKSEAGSGTWKFASLGRWCNGGIHQQKTIGPWCRAEICKNQAVHYVNRLCSIIILYTVYVYIYTANTSRSGTREVYWRHHPSRILMSVTLGSQENQRLLGLSNHFPVNILKLQLLQLWSSTTNI